jgi:DNA-binding Lrp family transcriptional regulator
LADEKYSILFEAQQNATKAIEDIQKSLVALEGQVAKSNNSFKKIGETFTGVFSSQAVLKAIDALGDASRKLFDVFIVQGIHAAQEQEDAINRLSTAFSIAGIESNKATKSFEEFASGLEATTKFSDDAIISAAALLESMTKLDEKGLKKATEAAVNLSAQFGISLEEAITKVGKAANGEVTALNKLGLEVQKGATDAETYANAMRSLATLQGAAAAQTNTFSGAVARFNNIFNNLQEITGGVVVKNQAVINVINELSKVLVEVANELKKNERAYKELVADGIIFFVESMKTAIAVTQKLEPLFKVLNTAALNLAAPLILAAKAISLLGKTPAPSPLVESLNKIEEAAKRGKDAIVSGNEEINNSNNNRAQNEANRAAENEAKRQEELAKEIAQIQARNDTLKMINDQRSFDEINANNALIDQKLAAEQHLTDELLKLKGKQVKSERDSQRERLTAVAGGFGDLATLTQTKNKDLFEAGKAFAIAQATISGALAIQNALATPPFPLGLFLATAAAVKTAVQISNISAQTLATGMTSVPGTGTSDNFPAILAPNERVLSRNQNEDLTSFLASQQDNRDILLLIAEGVHRSQPVNVSIGGNQVFDAVNEEVRNGRRFAS